MAGYALPLLLIGGGAAVVVSSKKKKRKKGGGKMYALVSDKCLLIGKIQGEGIENWSEEKIMRFLHQILSWVKKLYSDFGINTLDVPGDPQNNQLWAQAVATRGLRDMANPACLKAIGAPENFGADANPHGPDMNSWENWPGDSRTVFEDILFGVHQDMRDRGLNLGDTGEGKAFSFVSNTRGDYLAKAMVASME